MTWQTKRSLWLLTSLLLIAGWLATPVMRQVRHSVWSQWSATVSRLAGVQIDYVSEDGQQRLEALLADNIRLRAELTDYYQLREQLNADAFPEFQAVPAVVVGRPLDTFRSQLMINRGTVDGIGLGAPVVISSSTLVGFVTELNATSSVVTLLFHPQTTVVVDVVTPENTSAQGLVEGARYTTLTLTTIPRDFPLQPDYGVVTRGKPREVPYGLVLGTVQTITSKETEVYQEATLRLSYDVDALRAVNVLRPL